MAAVRFFFAILAAPILGALASELLLFNEVSRFGLGLAYPVALVGVLLVAFIFYNLVEAGWVRWFAYLLMLPTGACLGVLILWFPDGPHWAATAVGFVYGGITSLCWISLSWILDIFDNRAPNSAKQGVISTRNRTPPPISGSAD